MKKKILLIFIVQLFFCSFSFAQKIEQEDFNLEFFKKFQDEILIQNLENALDNNLDLKIAISKVKESERIVKLSLSQELPQIDFSPMLLKTFSSSDLYRGKNNFSIKSYNLSRFLLPVYVSYEVDIWGKNRLKTKSKIQSLKMIEQDKKASYIMLLSSLACNYFNLVRIDELLNLENEFLNLNKDLAQKFENKEKYGLANKDEVLAIKQNTIKVQNIINNLEIEKEILENQISYLLGDKFFSEIKRKDFNSVVELNKTPQVLNSNIILNRPDVILAAENIKRAQYDARIAKKELLPTFTIQGTFGFNGYHNLKGISANHTGLAEISVLPNLNIFDGLKRYNLIKLKKLELERATREYEKAVLSSIQEVNDNLAILKNENKNYLLSNEVLNIQNEKLRLKQNSLTYGLSSDVDVILYKQAQILAKEKMVDNKINLIISSINLYKATGGTNYEENL